MTNTTIDYYYNAGWQVVEERRAVGAGAGAAQVHTQYLWCPSYIDTPVLRWRDTSEVPNQTLNETLYYTVDANKNVTALVEPGTSTEDGTVVERYLYDPHGRVTVLDNDWNEIAWSASRKNEILCAGYRYNPETGYYEIRHRELNPLLGRWMQRDPLGYVDGENLYEYVRSAPVRYVDPSGLLLIAVDGTGSRERLAGGPATATGRWFSHVRNFYDDYTELPKAYWHGPDSRWPWIAGPEVNAILLGAREWLCEQWCEDQQLPIDMVGHSRGGFTVLELARSLKDDGCCCKGIKLAPVPVRFLGLYDPVDMAWGVGADDTVSDNVQHAYAIYPHPAAKTRQSFRRPREGPENPALTNYGEEEVLASHGEIGGDPWPNRGFQDRWGGIISDRRMRFAARRAGVQIRQLVPADYGYELRKWYDKERMRR